MVTKLRDMGVKPLVKNLPGELFRVAERRWYFEIIPRLFRPLLASREELQCLSTEMFKFAEKEQFRIESHNQNHIPSNIKRFLGDYTTRPKYVYELSEAVIHPSGIVSLKNGKIIKNSFSNYISFSNIFFESIISHWGRALNTYRQTGKLNPFNVSPRNTLQEAFILSRLWNGHLTPMSYYHWLVEYLPKLRALEVYENRTGKEPPILIESNPPNWLTEQLQIVGIDDSRLTHMPEDGIKVNNLVYPIHRHHSGHNFNPSTNDLKWVRKVMKEAIDIDESAFSDKVYLSRGDADDRRVVNQDELMSCLANYGFECYQLSNMSERDGINLFASANWIIGPHGAGLTNLIFADTVNVIEILPASYLDPSYYCISSQLGFGYHHILADQVGNDIFVDVEHLEDMLESIMNG